MMEKIVNEDMYVLCSPDGIWQAMTLAPDFATCLAQLKMLHKAGISKSYHELCMVQGYEVLPVRVSMEQTGTAEEGFQRAKEQL